MRRFWLIFAVFLCCRRSTPTPEAQSPDQEMREHMVSEIDASTRTLDAMRRVPRHLFAPELTLDKAYADAPEPIGFGQTISQPRIVAHMTDALELTGSERVLEIGTGSGYQAAVLSLLAREIYSIEIVPELGERTKKRLSDLGYTNVTVRIGNGYAGWPEKAPFDRIIITAAPATIPDELTRELIGGGILVTPLGVENQRLIRLKKQGSEWIREDLGGVRFVPMVDH